MYRKGKDYDRMAKLAISVIIDYGIKSFPLDMESLCLHMGFRLVPYSLFEGKKELLMKKSKDGFFEMSKDFVYSIVYNDCYGELWNEARKNQTLGHEIKHILDGDVDDSTDDLCEYFSKYLRCPIPYVIYKGYDSSFELVRDFGISYEQARIVISNVQNRKRKYGNKYFKYEIELLEYLLGEKFDINNFEVVDSDS